MNSAPLAPRHETPTVRQPAGRPHTNATQYKNALAKYFPGENAGYGSRKRIFARAWLIQAVKQTGAPFDTEKLIDTLESLRNLDLGLGTPLGFGRAEHQAAHKIWGTALDQSAKYQAIELE